MTRLLFPWDGGAAPDRARFGGKAAALARLHGTEARIPEWFVLSPRAYHESQTSPGPSRSDVYPSPSVVAEAAAALERLGLDKARLAVRSSALDEDGDRRAYAGIYETRLNVAPERLPEAIAAVWRSGLAARLAAYRGERAGAASAPLAVIVQRQIDAEVSGVAFSADPLEARGDRCGDRCVVAATAGLGDRLVAGEIDGDTFRVDEAGRIVERAHGPDPVAISDADIARIARLARFAARRFGAPQDIEWAISDGELFLLQSRPITTVPAPNDEREAQVALWDNSNIIESYGGVTTPLTFSFARVAYENVYRRFSRLMGVRPRRIADEDQLFRNMLGLIRGRVYYNLLNWYRLIALFPGFSLNRRYMERMMGVSDALSEAFGARLAPARSRRARARALDLFWLSATLASMAWNRVRLRASIARFQRRLDAALAEDGPPLSRLCYAALVQRYRELERRLLGGWDAPLVNDFYCMMAVGALSGFLKRRLGEDGARLAVDLVKCDQAVISVEPIARIRAMARRAAATPSIQAALLTGSPGEARAALASDPALERDFEAYLERFADRCFAELKLESPSLRDDPLPLLRSIGQAAAMPAGAPRPARDPAQEAAEGVLAAHFRTRPALRAVLALLVAEARARTRDRENLRLERTRVFGAARRLFQEMGERLHRRGVLCDPRDVFYLELGELLGFAEGTASSAELGPIARARKAEFEAYAKAPDPPPRFVTTGAVQFGDIRAEVQDRDDEPPDGSDRRRGMGASPGTVRGRVRVVRDPRDAEFPAGAILVADHTDPGWVTLFVHAAGVVVERGSLLSHSAIVAREMGVPAVVALRGATRWLSDDDVVEIDGRTGEVTRLLGAAGAAAGDEVEAA